MIKISKLLLNFRKQTKFGIETKTNIIKILYHPKYI